MAASRRSRLAGLITFSGLHPSDTFQQAFPTFSREMTSFQLDKASVFKSSGPIRFRFARTVRRGREILGKIDRPINR
jgi:hypothetical protein